MGKPVFDIHKTNKLSPEMNTCSSPFRRERCASPRQKLCHSRSVGMLREGANLSEQAAKPHVASLLLYLTSYSHSTAYQVTKASTVKSPCNLLTTAKFTRSSQAYRPCLPALHQCQGQGCLICPNVT